MTPIRCKLIVISHYTIEIRFNEIRFVYVQWLPSQISLYIWIRSGRAMFRGSSYVRWDVAFLRPRIICARSGRPDLSGLSLTVCCFHSSLARTQVSKPQLWNFLWQDDTCVFITTLGEPSVVIFPSSISW